MVIKQYFSLNFEEKMFLYKKLMRANKENGCFDLFKKNYNTCSIKQFLDIINAHEKASYRWRGNKRINVYYFTISYLWQNIRSAFLCASMANDFLLASYCTMRLMIFVGSLRKSGHDTFDEIADYIEACELDYFLFTIVIKTDINEVNEFLKANNVDLASVLRNMLKKRNKFIGQEAKLTVKNIIRNLEGKAPWENV